MELTTLSPPLTFMAFDGMFIISIKYDVGGMWSFKWAHSGVIKLLQSWISWPQCVIDRLISIHQHCIYRDKSRRLAPFNPKIVTYPLGPVDAELVDGNEAIYHTLWPRNSILKKFADTLWVHLKDHILSTSYLAGMINIQSNTTTSEPGQG